MKLRLTSRTTSRTALRPTMFDLRTVIELEQRQDCGIAPGEMRLWQAQG